MPPDLDIYALTRRRDRATIERFLDEYVDRSASEDRGDEEIGLEPTNYFEDGWDGENLPESQTLSEEVPFEWEPSHTLSDVINRGLAYPRRAFTIYVMAKDPSLSGALLAFTRDNQLVLGVSIDDEGAQPENERRAIALLSGIMQSYHAHAGLILVEEAPPRGEQEFHTRARHPLNRRPGLDAVYYVASSPEDDEH